MTYMTRGELIRSAMEAAKSDELWEPVEKAAVTDYINTCSEDMTTCLRRCEFDVMCAVTYGGSEGIYGSILLNGNYGQGETKEGHLHLATVKTLETSREAYIAMHTLCGIICYHANRFVGKHLDRFD